MNNAGIGLSASATPEQVMATNLHGTRRVTDVVSRFIAMH